MKNSNLYIIDRCGLVAFVLASVILIAGCPVGVIPPTQDSEVTSDPNDVQEDTNAPPQDPEESSGEADSPALPTNAYCKAVEDWSPDWDAWEQEVLDLINVRRSGGATCGANGSFDPAGPLTMNGALQCAARNHSMDMALRDFFAHTDPDGQGPGGRIALSEYEWRTWGENIAWGYPSPDAVVEGWMASDGHCANIMNASFTEIGVGYYQGNLWTQAFGAPR